MPYATFQEFVTLANGQNETLGALIRAKDATASGAGYVEVELTADENNTVDIVHGNSAMAAMTDGKPIKPGFSVKFGPYEKGSLDTAALNVRTSASGQRLFINARMR